METLFPDDIIENDTENQRNISKRIEENYEESDDILFNETEVTEAVKAQDYQKSPGLDGFTADIVIRLHSIDQNLLNAIYNKCLTFGLFPDIWKISVVKETE